MPNYLVTADEMRAVEARAAARGETGPVLMDRAARRVAAVVAEGLAAPGGRPAPVLVLAGPGNNGGDGLWAARYLHERGVPVAAYCWRRAETPDTAAQAAREAGVPLLAAAEDAEHALLRRLLGEAGAVLDALLGFGLQRDVVGDLAALIDTVAATAQERAAAGRPLPIFAVDIPTGVDSDTGRVRGTALPAQVTVTLGLAKRGLYLFPGATYAGEVLLEDIGVFDLTENLQVTETTAEQVRGLLPARPADSNKGTFGSVLLVAGSLNYIGASVLATLGAMRAGVGLATLATPIDLVSTVAARLIECTYLPLPSDQGVLTERAVAPLFKALSERHYKAMLVGNGLGHERETLNFMRGLLEDQTAAGAHTERTVGFATGRRTAEAPASHAPGREPVRFGLARRPAEPTREPEAESTRRELPPLVVDADGLNMLHEIEGGPTRLPANSILTPHPGEMARLLDSDVDTVQADRVGLARKAAADWGQIVVLKGANTVIAAPDGRLQINAVATAALATAGTGDVLAGCIAGLLAQGLAPFDAAVAGVFVHGRAGQIVAERLGDAGVLAGDVADALPLALRAIKAG